jgi:DNA-binding IclR family transcriptional regulator
MVNVEPPPSILSKAFELLYAFNSGERVMTLSDLARASGLPKSTVHRLLARLIELRAIEHHRTGYRIGLGIFELGAHTPVASMRERVLPYLAGLHRWTGQTVHFAVLRQFDVVYLEKLALQNSPSTMSGVGDRLPAHCTAIGKAMLAYENLEDLAAFLPNPLPRLTLSSIGSAEVLVRQLREIRRGSLAREREEAQTGLACIASPIVVKGFAVGAISISHRTDTDPGVDTALRDATARIAKEAHADLSHRHAQWFPYET